MLRLHAGETGRDEDGREALGCDDPHGAPHAITAAGCRPEHLFDDVLERRGPGGHIPADRGQLPAVGSTVEQPDAERCLQPVQPAAHGGVIHAQQGGRRDQAARARHRQQVAQIVGADIQRIRPVRAHALTIVPAAQGHSRAVPPTVLRLSVGTGTLREWIPSSHSSSASPSG